MGFHDLHLRGKPNEAGLYLHHPSLVSGERQFDLAIENNRIVGQHNGVTKLSGSALLGAEILIDTIATDDPSPAYKIRIDSVRSETFAFPLTTMEQVELYVFRRSKADPTTNPDPNTTADAGTSADADTTPDAGPTPETGTTTDAGPTPETGTTTDASIDAGTSEEVGTIARTKSGSSNLCSNPPFYLLRYGAPDEPHAAAYSELLRMNPEEALVFAGDRIDATRKTMSERADPLWFNFGCASHALAKLFMTRNTIASTEPSFMAPDHAMRQATLKLLVADYCGTGTPFTVAGQLLNWKGYEAEAKRDFYTMPNIKNVEARWNENGAICLEEPRVEFSDLKAARSEFPNVRQAIKIECGRNLPVCATNTQSLEKGLRISTTTYPL